MIYELCLFIIANTLIFAAVMKVIDRARFFEQMNLLFKLPNTYAWIIPFTELVCGLGLFIAPHRFAILALILSLVFLIIVLWMIKYHKNQACHCFGTFSDTEIGLPEVVRNAILLLLACYICFGSEYNHQYVSYTVNLYILSIGFVCVQIQIAQLSSCMQQVKTITSRL